MKKIKTGRLWVAVGILCTLTLTLIGCTKDDRTECPQEIAIGVTVKGADGEDITDQGVMTDLSLYVFDGDKLFLTRLDARVNESLRLYFPDQDIIHVVSWGNLSQERLQLPSLVVGTPMHAATIRLKNDLRHPAQAQPKAPASRSIAMTPDDLFYSYNEILLKTGAQTSYTINMNRRVAAMSITLRNLQSYANRYDENYSLVVRETYNTIDFLSRLIGEKVGYMPPSSFNKKKELIAPLFNLLPSHAEDGIEIDVYHDGQLITTVKRDSQGKPLRTQTGKVLNVLIDFNLQVNVEVSITPWGIIHIWKEY